jgi:hypothetical protein
MPEPLLSRRADQVSMSRGLLGRFMPRSIRNCQVGRERAGGVGIDQEREIFFDDLADG